MWKVYINEGNSHIIPLKDRDYHTQEVDCHCKPKAEILSNGSIMYIHRAFDLRGVIEEVNRILNN